MSDQPIEPSPSDIQLSGERTDGADIPPKPPVPPSNALPDFMPPPRSETPPPPPQPPAAPPPPPPTPPTSGGAGLPEPHEWWRGGRGGGGGGVATAPAPVYASAPPTVHNHNYYYPAPVAPAGPPATAAPPQFSLKRLHPLWNLSALVVGALCVPGTDQVLHIFGDEYGVLLAGLIAAGIAELRYRGRVWVVRALSFNLLSCTVATEAGLHLLGWTLTGV
ncbi:hypothetical protein ACIA8O_38855 [Kitasatospora sp. NPDC051853]|uniref:hypothetical protein n=1 Tax=Kitasatospora sp. NPDC051853 TaxID=3364058 RepID=UPI0037A8E9FC